MVERGCCKEKKKTPYYHNTSNFFTQDISILKCSYVLKSAAYGKLLYQNKYSDVNFHVVVFLPLKLQNSINMFLKGYQKEMTPIICYRSLMKEMFYLHDT